MPGTGDPVTASMKGADGGRRNSRLGDFIR